MTLGVVWQIHVHTGTCTRRSSRASPHSGKEVYRRCFGGDGGGDDSVGVSVGVGGGGGSGSRGGGGGGGGVMVVVQEGLDW